MKKNIILRVLFFVLFVIGPICIMLNTPTLKQFFCDKKTGTCLIKVYNMFQQNPSYDAQFKIKDIDSISKDKCKEMFVDRVCLMFKTKDGQTYPFKYDFRNDYEVFTIIQDFNSYIANSNPKITKYKLISQQDVSDSNKLVTFWGVIIFLGFLVSIGVVKDTSKNAESFKFIKDLIKKYRKSKEED